MITIIDYGVGNLGSIANMLRKIGVESKLGRTEQDIELAEKIILPGVGAFDAGMARLNESGLIPSLNKRVLVDKVDVLGICLGAQMMTRQSSEGHSKGLGWFQADTVLMDFEGISGAWPLPNIGWRDVYSKHDYKLLSGYDEVPRFYFVHSYYMKPDNSDIVSINSSYGFDFACGLSKGNIHSVQFHPEKSHKFGMKFLRNFIELKANATADYSNSIAQRSGSLQNPQV